MAGMLKTLYPTQAVWMGDRRGWTGSGSARRATVVNLVVWVCVLVTLHSKVLANHLTFTQVFIVETLVH